MEKTAKTKSLYEFAERLKTIVSEHDSASKFAKKAGVSQSGFRKWINAQSEPGRDKLILLAKTGNVRLEWLASGEGPMREGEKEPPGGKDEYVLVPLHNAKVSAGPVTIGEGEREVARLAFLKQWVKQKGLAIKDLALVTVYGESMEPSFSHGDVVLVELGDGEMVRDGLHALRINDHLMVKRLQLLPGNRIRVTSDNPRYEPFEIDLSKEGDQIKVVGRVIWFGREI
ncbi:MAG: helix-turn-helix transcriptional regulator [Desulfarculus sp.]|nr:helix-turn-helix transcriptional regulator [Pseudomonadota bacterium]MBV1737348.1 helix-turn-helix transcriptional regulator [Desulfarculus sp.]